MPCPVVPVRTHRRRSILLIELDGPQRIPRLTRKVLSDLSDVLDSLSAEPALQGAVLAGTEKAFAAGAELSEVGELGALEALRFSELGQSLMRKLERSAKPIVAAIRGYCMGGGLDLALACHLRVAANDAVFAHPGPALGIITGWGGTARLPRILRPGHALELLVTGRALTATEALAGGLVNRATLPENVLPESLNLARKGIQSSGDSPR